MSTLDKQHKAKFGTVLGVAEGGVAVYSSHYASADRDDLPNRQAYRSVIDGVYLGYKWQCVELARRWLYLNKGYVFDDIAMAYDIFRLRHVTVVADGTKLPLHSFANGSKRPPEPGCLLIWNEGGEFDVTGHVAVATEVLPDRVRCIEQNVEDKIWPPGQSFSRELKATTGADGSYWIDCTYGNSGIMGWVIQTDDPTHAEDLSDPSPDLFNLRARELPPEQRADGPWLDQSRADDAAFLALMGGDRLSTQSADQFRYFHVSETAIREVKRATNELHAMFMHATERVLQDETLLRHFNLPPALLPRIRQSWDNRRNQMITGRFDFCLSERGLKVYEYNCDSASCHMETGRVQGLWAEHFGCSEGRDAGADLFKELVAAWSEAEVGGVLHIMCDRDAEETYHAEFMKTAMVAAGLSCKIVKGVAGLRWGADGRVLDAEGTEINWVWKTWAWETALDQIRDQLSEDDQNLRLGRTIDRATQPPRLVDVLLRPDVMVFEPLWSLIPSNKAMLPVLWSIFPDHPYLLDSHFELTDSLTANGYVVKPIVGRCGENIRIVDAANRLMTETEGRFDDRDRIYQQLFPLPRLHGLNVQLSSFSVAGTYAGSCLRTDSSAIITTGSDILPLRVLPDDDLAPGEG
ncbi:bifunctional glutathionylspermidine amidase/synthase [Magnetospira thiophila]